MTLQQKMISHGYEDGPGLKGDAFDIAPYKKALAEKKETVFSYEKNLSLLEELSQFELGRFFLKNKGLDGYWISYLILQGLLKVGLSPLEQWIVDKAPVVLATRQRYHIFQGLIADHLKDDLSLASLPCGVMDDLLEQDYSGFPTITLTGIDLDPAALEAVKERAHQKGRPVTLIKADAWDILLTDQYDVLVSNGLNIYEKCPERLKALYKNFHKLLKREGVLITSFLTPPPLKGKPEGHSPWVNYNPEDLRLQKALFSDIINANWQHFWTEEQMRGHLSEAGFEVVKMIYDTQKMFPTVLAKKQG